MNGLSDKWGFSPEKSHVIDLDTGDYTLYRKIAAKIPGIQACYFCGSCHATCTVQSDGMNFRKLHLLLRRGEPASLKQMVEPCVLCGKCSLVCPRNVDTRSVIYNLKILLHEQL
jgi:heterodisulfide reductase subunit C